MVIQDTSSLDWKMVFYVLLIIVLTGLYSIPIYIIHKLDVSNATLIFKGSQNNCLHCIHQPRNSFCVYFLVFVLSI